VLTLLWWLPQFTTTSVEFPGGAGSDDAEGNEPGEEAATSTIDVATELVHPVRVTSGVIH
jgi:hypothetical protein